MNLCADRLVTAMPIEIARLALGLLIALFHRPLSDFIVAQDRELVSMFRQRGLSLPGAMEESTSRNLFFSAGILVAVLQLIRIWMLYR